MTPQAFMAKWRDNPLTERAGAQAHFEDLCALLEVEAPRIEGEYQYKRGLIKKSSVSKSGRQLETGRKLMKEHHAVLRDLAK